MRARRFAAMACSGLLVVPLVVACAGGSQPRSGPGPSSVSVGSVVWSDPVRLNPAGTQAQAESAGRRGMLVTALGRRDDGGGRCRLFVAIETAADPKGQLGPAFQRVPGEGQCQAIRVSVGRRGAIVTLGDTARAVWTRLTPGDSWSRTRPVPAPPPLARCEQHRSVDLVPLSRTRTLQLTECSVPQPGGVDRSVLMSRIITPHRVGTLTPVPSPWCWQIGLRLRWGIDPSGRVWAAWECGAKTTRDYNAGLVGASYHPATGWSRSRLLGRATDRVSHRLTDLQVLDSGGARVGFTDERGDRSVAWIADGRPSGGRWRDPVRITARDARGMEVGLQHAGRIDVWWIDTSDGSGALASFPAPGAEADAEDTRPSYSYGYDPPHDPSGAMLDAVSGDIDARPAGSLDWVAGPPEPTSAGFWILGSLGDDMHLLWIDAEGNDVYRLIGTTG